MMEIKIYMNVLILLGGIKTVVLGADDFTVEVSESCFNDNDAVRLVVQYTGSGSPTAVRWKYDKMTNAAATLDVVISFCAASAGADPAFPVARMSYNCDTTNKQYNVTISSFNESTDAGLWEAAISVSGSFSNFKSVTVEKCLSTSTMPAATIISISTPTSTTPSTSATPTSTATTSSSKSTTLITASATAIRKTSTTSSITMAKSESTTTTSADISSSETVVIIVASVVGGLFIMGIVIAIILMLLSQRNRRKPVSKEIHTYEEKSNDWQVQGKSPNSQGHSKHVYTSYGKPSGYPFRQNPFFIRQSNRPVPYQYQPWNQNYRNYPGLTAEGQYSGRYAGQDRRFNETPDYYNLGNLRSHYYSYLGYLHNYRTHIRETLHKDDQSYVVSDYW